MGPFLIPFSSSTNQIFDKFFKMSWGSPTVDANPSQQEKLDAIKKSHERHERERQEFADEIEDVKWKLDTLKQRKVEAKDAYQHKKEMKDLKSGYDFKLSMLTGGDSRRSHMLGLMRREFHQRYKLDYCETCFKMLATGVWVLRPGPIMTHLDAQYCEDCAEDKRIQAA